MRCTLHLLSASEFPLYVAARSTHKARNWEYYFPYHGITPAEYDAFIAAVPHILGSTPMTREQLATALALQTTLEPMQNLKMSGEVRLLPLFDAYILGLGRDIEALLPKTYKSLVFRPQGWISAVVLVNGCIKGVWEYKTQRARQPSKFTCSQHPRLLLRRVLKQS
jgi:hypothetical protein